VTALDAAIKFGEEAVVRMITLSVRERMISWKLMRLRHLLSRGRQDAALRVAEETIALIGEDELSQIKWIHRLHQVTGLLALRGNGRLTIEDAKMIRATLRDVMREMEDKSNWVNLLRSKEDGKE
jgi:hypothetical protein